ncbi:hypothetical protein DAEQUDRAFT_728363 [Daedalea quercina L-15889]|uniref:RING-CH-type domain-containing protein n=1 Tax=Daedalea quercina L-15889 TaxID=1314783 RepID=A0A165PDY8_9APHY|nr:hypothetical protein DAEQUDRAFT_728363 [Daedalea quercina L-15889]
MTGIAGTTMQATPTTQSQSRIPTVDDLRVKLCFICREEEQYNSPEDPPRAWTHPCTCTLVAHEACLLQWIKAAQDDPTRALNALKCPQCGASYQLESDNPHPKILRLLDNANALLSIAGKVFVIGGLATVVVSFGFGVYLVLTSYGAHALRSMVGEEMYNILLTDEPSNWPWHAFINLPMIPVSLVLSRSAYFSSFPLLPLIISWPSSHPVTSAAARIGGTGWRLLSGPRDDLPYGPVFGWPPSPMMASLLFPLIGRIYREQYSKVMHAILGKKPSERGPVRDIVWDFGGEGPVPFRARIGLAVDPAERQRRQQQRREQREQQEQQEGQEGQEGQEQEHQPNAQAPAQDAEGQDQQGNAQTIRITNASIGRAIGGALFMPTIASFMGSVLYRLAKYSPTLRTILAIRPPLVGRRRIQLLGPWLDSQGFTRMSLLKKVGMSLHVALNLVCGGTRVWYESDPVWWRNSLGLGIFIVARDCIELLYLYLAKRDFETRRVKSRPFEGVDLSQLDLIHPPTSDASNGLVPAA